MKIGVLALQGDVREHIATLDRLGAAPVEVRHPDELADVEGIVLPGGESTTIGKLLDRFGLLEPLAGRILSGMPAYGTCAGLILLARTVRGRLDAPDRLGVLDASVVRNAYGRQVESFEADLEVESFDHPFHAVFIRAPRVEEVGDGVEVLARHEEAPVLIRQENILGSTFHPEMTEDGRIHQLFLKMVGG